MKREILFKGKRIDNGEWIVGQLAYFFDNKETPYIMPHCYFGTRELGEFDYKHNPIISNEIALGGFISVNPETVCQFTGLLDKNGKKIFEGDIIKPQLYHPTSEVFYMNGSFKVNGKMGKIGFGSWAKKVEIIGNIHD